MLRIDGAHGEGGGQLLRTALALSAITGRAIEVRDIRARRHPPGLAPQHLLAVRAVAALCRGQVEGAALRAPAIRFTPQALVAGAHDFDVGTAGSVTLVLQALLPVMLAARADTRVTLRGGTDVRGAPPWAYLAHVLLPNLQRMGARVRLELARRGYYPRGGGVIHASVQPCRLQPLALQERGPLIAIRGEAHVANLPQHIALRMRDSARALLVATPHVDIESMVLQGSDAHGQGGALVLWARCAHAVVGAGRIAELGVIAEALGESAAQELNLDLAAGATADLHAADQLLIYMALAGGGSLAARNSTPHALTGIWLIEQFLPVRFALSRRNGLTRISVGAR